jgi:Alw26I/Eco31I/Esp3I family type II restriction endonuclease
LSESSKSVDFITIKGGKMTKIDENPASYGSKGQEWNPDFVSYMVTIVQHPVYAGMPDAIKPDGKIQWEAPSNRSGGEYKDTHHLRRDWWRAKAASIGVRDTEDQWISRVAKTIHPTGEKPCKRCGQNLRIAYVYPNGYLTKRAVKLFGEELRPSETEEISEYINRIVDVIGIEALEQLPKLLRTDDIKPPVLGKNLDAWLEWIEDEYIPKEPSLLSPGAMSNAPDRFDGFHSFNRCCRGVADSGRHAGNMKSYTTDRRVFEYWSEGNWIAADRMMGIVRAKCSDHPTADGGEGAPSADHIGPLSLGFSHRPEFRLLSRSANSAKNNRMTLWDVDFLKNKESNGESVVSWYARPIWDTLKSRVENEETALRLSKIMRDNQRNAMMILARLLRNGHSTFLATLLDLSCADYKIEFENLKIEDFVTVYSNIISTPRTTKYASEQKSRRLRVGFMALKAYESKENRHFYKIDGKKINDAINEAERALGRVDRVIKLMDTEILELLGKPGTPTFEEQLRSLTSRLSCLGRIDEFEEAKACIAKAMTQIAEGLACMWNDDRYIRAEFAFD